MLLLLKLKPLILQLDILKLLIINDTTAKGTTLLAIAAADTIPTLAARLRHTTMIYSHWRIQIISIIRGSLCGNLPAAGTTATFTPRVRANEVLVVITAIYLQWADFSDSLFMRRSVIRESREILRITWNVPSS